MKINKTVADYWMKYYASDAQCLLCRDGFLTTITTGASRVPCICPNGQMIRANTIKVGPGDVYSAMR